MTQDELLAGQALAVLERHGYIKRNPPKVEIEVDGRGKFLQDIYEEVKKICEDHNGNYELRIKVTNVNSSDLVKTDISKTIQDTTKKYLENTAQRGVLTEEKIKQIVNEELDKQAVKSMKATYPPELWKALQEEFPCLKSDSHE